MNWAAFLILLWLFAGMEWGLRDALQFGQMGVAPSFLMILMVFVSLWASASAAIGATLVIGIAMDLLHQYSMPGGVVVVLGPHAIGALLGASLVLNLRALVFRRDIWTIAFLTVFATAVAMTVVSAMVALRAAYDPSLDYPGPAARLAEGALSAVYTGVLAIIVGPVLGLLRPLLGFPVTSKRAFSID